MKIIQPLLTDLLWQFSQEHINEYQQKHGHLPYAEVEQDWPSPCQQSLVDDNKLLWQPTRIEEDVHFKNVESALSLTLHQDIKDYYCSFYSAEIPASSDDGKLSLLFPWSHQDFARLQENIIGHVLMKQKLKQELTIFFATTDNDEYLLSMKNTSGEIWVERVGCEPHKKLANSMVEFIQTLTCDVEVE